MLLSEENVFLIDLIIEEPDLQEVLHVLHPISHGQISQRVSHQ